MPESMSYYRSLAAEMIEQDADKLEIQGMSDDMYYLNWELPGELEEVEWIRKQIDLQPHNAIFGAARIYSTLLPNVKIDPVAKGKENKQRANELETWVKWMFENAAMRRETAALRDILLSAILYDEVICEVEYIPWQVEVYKTLGKNPNRLRAALRHGEFVINRYNPRGAHARYNKYGLQAMLRRSNDTILNVSEEWGAKAQNLLNKAGGKKDAVGKWCTVFDYIDHDTRAIWAVPTDDAVVLADPEGGYKILSEDHELPWVPYVARVGGSTLENKGGYQRHPMTYSIAKSGKWDEKNLMLSLMSGEVVAHVGSPRGVIEGPGGERIRFVYGDPMRILSGLGPGQTYKPLEPPSLDSALFTLIEKISAEMGEATISPVIMGTTNLPSGVPFAALNLVSKSSLKSLSPWKGLAEQAVGDIMRQMLYWKEFTGDPIYTKEGQLNGRDIWVDDLYIKVELQEDMPTDQQQRVLVGVQAVRELGYSKEKALEQIGENDPQAIFDDAFEEKYEEMLEAAELSLEGQRYQMLGMAEQAGLGLLAQMLNSGDPMIMQALQQLQQQVIQAQQQQAQQQQTQGGNGRRPQGQEQPPNPANEGLGVEGVGGQGYNPAVGGTPPSEAAPGATAEGQRGRGRGE